MQVASKQTIGTAKKRGEALYLKYMGNIIILIVTCMAFAVLHREVYSAENILLTTQVWPPYQTYENNVVDGFAAQVVKCTLDKMGQPYEIRIYPWKRAQNMVKAGDAHGFFSASHNKIREKDACNLAPPMQNVRLLL